MLFQGVDEHYCLKCGITVSGLSNYLDHQKRGCHPEEEDDTKKPTQLGLTIPQPDETPTDQFFSVLQLQRRSEVPICEKSAAGVVTRSKAHPRERRKYVSTKRNLRKTKEKKPEDELSDVWLHFDERQHLKSFSSDLGSMSPGYNLDEVRDAEVDKILQDVQYESYDFMAIDDVPFENKPKPVSSPVSWFNQWDVLEPDDPEPTKGRRHPPPSFTGGKWKPQPETGGKWKPHPETGGKWKPYPETGGKWRNSPVEKRSSPLPDRSRFPSETGGKWKPHSETGGKWRSSPVSPLADKVEKFSYPSETGGKWKAPPETGGKWKAPPETGGKWRHPLETGGKWRHPPETGGKKPHSETGGKWRNSPIEKINSPPYHSETGGKWRSSPSSTPESPTDTFPPDTSSSHPPASHTSGKWPPAAHASGKWPPAGHSKGKWLPQSGGKCQKTSGGGVEYYCSTCRRRLASKEMFKRHIKSDFHLKRATHEKDLEFDARYISPKRREVKVPGKFESSLEEKAGKLTLVLKKKKVKCSTCSTRLLKGKLGKHYISYHHYKRFNARDPEDRKQILANIHAIVRQSPYQCSPCHFYCNTAAHFRNHWHGENHQENARKGSHFWCSFCKFRTTSADEVRNHLDSEKHREVVLSINGSVPIIIRNPEDISCDTCALTCSLNIRKAKHVAIHPTCQNLSPSAVYSCRSCDCTTSSRKSLLMHGIRVHGDAKASTDFYCDVCNVSFKTAAESVKHRTTSEHKNAVKLKQVKAGTLDPILLERTCSKCTEVVATPKELAKHMKLMHGKTHICPKCGKSFLLSQQVSQHAKSECRFPVGPRNSEMPWSCLLCAFGCQLEADFKFHGILHSAQANEKLLACPDCEKFFTKGKMRAHLHNHTKEFFQCANCGKSFFNQPLLEFHSKYKCKRKRKEAKDASSLKCSECNYVAKTNTLLKRHMLTHEEKRNFQCPHCPFQGKLLEHLRRHLRIHTGSKPFHCPHCEFRANLLENLRKHVVASHKEKRLYHCKFCSYAHNLVNPFEEHLKTKHPSHYDPLDRTKLWGVYNETLELQDVMTTEEPAPIKTIVKCRRKNDSPEIHIQRPRPSILRPVPIRPRIAAEIQEPVTSSNPRNTLPQIQETLEDLNSDVCTSKSEILGSEVCSLSSEIEEPRFLDLEETGWFIEDIQTEVDIGGSTEMYVVEDGKLMLLQTPESMCLGL